MDLRTLGMECIGQVIRRGRLQWLGHMKRDENDGVKHVEYFEVKGRVPGVSPKKKYDKGLRKVSKPEEKVGKR